MSVACSTRCGATRPEHGRGVRAPYDGRVAVTDLAFVVGAYLVGTFPTAHLVGARRGVDPTREGSGNPGASNLYRTAGRRAGALVALGDVLKGLIPTAVALGVDGRPLALSCWIAAVLGHVFPITRRLRGGKGVATAGGGTIVLFPIIAALLLAMFVVAVRATRIAAIGSLVMAVALPVLVGLSGRPASEVVAAIAVSVLVVARHGDNIRRLVRREELLVR